MGFANPIQPTIQNTVNVTVGGKDFYLWPAYSGEDYPPTLGTGASYGRLDGSPAYKMTPGTTGASPLSFNPVGAIGPDSTKTTLVVQFQAYMPNSAGLDPPQIVTGYGPSAQGTARVGLQASGAQGARVIIGGSGYYAAASDTKPADGYKYLALGWHQFTVRYRADGTASPILCDGLPLWITADGQGKNYYQATMTASLPVGAGDLLSSYYLYGGSGTVAGSVYVRNVYATWEKP